METYSRHRYDHKRAKLLPHIQRARSLGYRRLNDILAVVQNEQLKSFPGHKPITRSALYRAMVRLREIGQDPGPDDLSTARRHGRPTKRVDRLDNSPHQSPRDPQNWM